LACRKTATNSRRSTAWPSPCARACSRWPAGCGSTAPTANCFRAWPISCAGCSKIPPTNPSCARASPTARPRIGSSKIPSIPWSGDWPPRPRRPKRPNPKAWPRPSRMIPWPISPWPACARDFPPPSPPSGPKTDG